MLVGLSAWPRDLDSRKASCEITDRNDVFVYAANQRLQQPGAASVAGNCLHVLARSSRLGNTSARRYDAMRVLHEDMRNAKVVACACRIVRMCVPDCAYVRAGLCACSDFSLVV